MPLLKLNSLDKLVLTHYCDFNSVFEKIRCKQAFILFNKKQISFNKIFL